MQRYCLGFAFDDHGGVALIRKNRPDWQAGKLNGIGGHVEDGEATIDSMVREFKEETGLLIARTEWEQFVVMSGPKWIVRVFRTRHAPLQYVQTTTDELVRVQPVHQLPYREVLSNLNWMIPLALDVGEPNSPRIPLFVNF